MQSSPSYTFMGVLATSLSIAKSKFLFRKSSCSRNQLPWNVKTINKINESRYNNALSVVSESIKKLFSIDYVSIYLFSIFFFNRFCPVENCGVTPHCYMVIHYYALPCKWLTINSELKTLHVKRTIKKEQVAIYWQISWNSKQVLFSDIYCQFTFDLPKLKKERSAEV